jgi:hypothetical protein
MPDRHAWLLRSRRGRPQIVDEGAVRAVQLERGCLPVPGLWVRIVLPLLALNAAIWHNWLIGAPVKRSLVAYDCVSP